MTEWSLYGGKGKPDSMPKNKRDAAYSRRGLVYGPTYILTHTTEAKGTGYRP